MPSPQGIIKRGASPAANWVRRLLEEVLLTGIFIFSAAHYVLGFVDELANVAEFAVHGGEAHISDRIETAQILHHDFADDITGHLALISAGDFFFNGVNDLGDVFGGDGTFVTGLLNAGEDAVAIEGNAGAVFFDDLEADGFFDAFISGVSAFAMLTDAPAADGLAIFDGARINDAILVIHMAKRATHEQSEQGQRGGRDARETSRLIAPEQSVNRHSCEVQSVDAELSCFDKRLECRKMSMCVTGEAPNLCQPHGGGQEGTGGASKPDVRNGRSYLRKGE